MKLSRNWMKLAYALPVIGAAGYGAWRHSAEDHQPQAPPPTMAVAVSAKPGEQVDRVEHMICEVRQGWPVILVRDANATSPWWVQAQAQQEATNRYKARVHFGKTATGQRYEIVVLSAPDESAAHQFETGTTLKEIPGLPRSEMIEVVRR